MASAASSCGTERKSSKEEDWSMLYILFAYTTQIYVFPGVIEVFLTLSDP